MSDVTTQPAPAQAAATTQPSDLKPLAEDIQHAVSVAVAAVKAYKAEGAGAIAKQAPQIIAEVEKDYEDASKAAPAIKAGVKTTEFWLIAGFLVGNAAYVGLTGKALPVDVDAVLGTVLSIYAALRHVAKSNTTATT
jgi:hypothetical protein